MIINSAMYGADSGLENIVRRNVTAIDSNVASIGDYVCYQWTTLLSVNLPNADVIGAYAFTTNGTGDSSSYSQLTTVNIPSATVINNSAFRYCANLTTINMDSVITIKNYAFAYCNGLTTLVFPNTLTIIGGGAFRNCESLTSIVLPVMEQSSSPLNMGNSAFANCPELATIDLTAYTEDDDVPSIGTNVFASTLSEGVTRQFLFSDTMTLSKFARATNWSAYASEFTTVIT